MNKPINWQPDNLENELVKLYPIHEEDFTELYSVASDPMIWEQHPSSDRYKEEIFRAFFQNGLECKSAFTIKEKGNDRIIGSTRFYKYDPIRNCVYIGYTFLARKYWGGEYNRSVKKLMLDYAFKFVDKIIFEIGSKNIRSQVALSKLGVKKTREYFPENQNSGAPFFEYTLFKNQWNS